MKLIFTCSHCKDKELVLNGDFIVTNKAIITRNEKYVAHYIKSYKEWAMVGEFDIIEDHSLWDQLKVEFE